MAPFILLCYLYLLLFFERLFLSFTQCFGGICDTAPLTVYYLCTITNYSKSRSLQNFIDATFAVAKRKPTKIVQFTSIICSSYNVY